MIYILSIIGAVLVFEGIPYFAFPGKAKEWALSIQEIPNGMLRVMGFVAMMMGLMFIFLSKFVFAG